MLACRASVDLDGARAGEAETIYIWHNKEIATKMAATINEGLAAPRTPARRGDKKAATCQDRVDKFTHRSLLFLFVISSPKIVNCEMLRKLRARAINPEDRRMALKE